MNLKLISVPDPTNAPPWNAEIMRCPGFDAFGVIDIAELSVPAISVGGEAGVTTVGSNETCISYEMTPNPVRSPTVTGITTRPGVAVMLGSETGTPDGVPAAVGVNVAVAVEVAVNAGVFVGVFVDVFVAVDVDVGVLVEVAVNTGVLVGVLVAVFVAVAVSVGVGVNVAVLAAVGVFVAVFVGVAPPGIVTLPLVVEACGSPSLNINPGWKPPLGFV